jgi:4-hydroxybenzoate polyprenyltransferase
MFASYLRTLLIFGRVSNLPTVWSNCFAAWTLAGGGEGKRLAVVLASGSCLYVGGMFLNDACDAEFDRQHRPERPIPSGLISRSAVWAWASGTLLAGTLLAAPLGGRATVYALALLAAIVAYDFWHKRHPAALGFMAGCRLLLYLFAGITAAGNASPQVLTAAAGMGCYVLGISLLARHESGVRRPPG